MAASWTWSIDHLGRNTLSMLSQNLIYSFIGLILGYLAGLGVGGGSLLMLWLTVFLSIDTRDAQIINLLFFLSCAGSVTLIRLKKGTLQFRVLLPGIVAGCLFAIAASMVGKIISQELLRKLLGIVFLITGVRELLYRLRKAK